MTMTTAAVAAVADTLLVDVDAVDNNDNDGVDESELTDFILSYGNSEVFQDSCSTSTCLDSTVCTYTGPATAGLSSSESSSAAPHPPHKHLREDTPSVVAVLPRSPNFFSPSSRVTSIECSCFSYFRHVTGPAFASYFDSSIWRAYTTNAALVHPVVFYTAAALGAVHRRFNYGITREAFEYCAHAARLHARAVKGLEELKAQRMNAGLIGSASTGGAGMGVYDRDVIMTSEMLLGLFEAFQSNYDRTVEHMNRGIKYMLARPMTLVHTESRYCTVESKPHTFRRLFHQLRCRAIHLFGSPTRILARWASGASLPKIPGAFANLEEARDFMFTEVDWIMNAPAREWTSSKRSEAQVLHVQRLLMWSVAYAETVKEMERTALQKRACNLLKLVRNATYLLLYMTLFVEADAADSEVNTDLPPTLDIEIDGDPDQDGGLAYASKALWDVIQKRKALNTNLGRVRIMVDGILDENSIFNYDEHSVSFDSAIGPPRASERVPESSAKTRHLVKGDLRQKAGCAALWEIQGIYGVAERVSAVEEHAVIASIRDIIPEHLDPRWVDISCLMESRKILLRYCRPDELGLGMVWTQEWWAF